MLALVTVASGSFCTPSSGAQETIAKPPAHARGACSRAATIACSAADDRLELLGSLRALRAAGLMIAHGFTVEQMVEIVRRARATATGHAMGAGGAPSGTRPAHHHEDLAADTTAGEPRAMKVYLDNVIVSGRVRGDLHPPEEMAAVHALAEADEEGQIEIYTSRWSWAEQDRTRDDFLRVKLKESRGEIEVVAGDHRVLGFWNQEDPRVGTVSTNPMVTEIVDERLFSDLKKVGLLEGDARHLMYAIHNKCDRFVTLDTRDLLPKRSHVASLCRGTKIVTPSELAAELSAS
jgi:predicted nucleic acid-binding protein